VNLGVARSEEAVTEKAAIDKPTNGNDLVFHQPVVDYDMASSGSEPNAGISHTNASQSPNNANGARDNQAANENTNSSTATSTASRRSKKTRAKGEPRDGHEAKASAANEATTSASPSVRRSKKSSEAKDEAANK
jgi:hypothetical protein